jgi:RNA 3'-terminal phosphate cyclase (ATP)
MAGYLESSAAVGPYLADQLLLPMALAGGGSFTTVKPSQHALTAAEIIGRFLPVTVRFDEREEGRHLVTVSAGG